MMTGMTGLRAAVLAFILLFAAGVGQAGAQDIRARLGTSLPDSHPQTPGANKCYGGGR